MPLISSFDIGDPNILSDHSFLYCSIWANSPHSNNRLFNDENIEYVSYKYVWDDNLLNEFKTRLCSPDVTVIFKEARDTLGSEQISPANIDTGLNLIVEGIETCTKPLFSKPLKVRYQECSFSDNKLPWFDDNCRMKRIEFYRFLNIFRNDKTDQNRFSSF